MVLGILLVWGRLSLTLNKARLLLFSILTRGIAIYCFMEYGKLDNQLHVCFEGQTHVVGTTWSACWRWAGLRPNYLTPTEIVCCRVKAVLDAVQINEHTKFQQNSIYKVRKRKWTGLD